LQRIVLEAVANTLQHGHANRLRFTAGARPDGDVEIRIEDNGRGFDSAGVHDGPGLLNMRHRAERLGARFSVDSSPGGGTVVRLVIPEAATSQKGANASSEQPVEAAPFTAFGPQTA
jgi:signal transduction histidine kinase